jgi:non-heme chloroperoxidase
MDLCDPRHGMNRLLGLRSAATDLATGVSLALVVAITGCRPDPAPDVETTAPPAVHRITVDREVALEVLDAGGDGPPLVFLAGFGNSAHIFTDFAARFRDDFRVVAITRRGFGRSSFPATGYDNARLADDVVAVLDTLGLPRALLVAHSFGGAELNALARRHPERLRGLVYLDGGFDFAELYADSAWVNTPVPRPPRRDTATGHEAEAAYLSLMTGPNYPVAEVEVTADAMATDGAPGFVRDSLPTWLMRGTPSAALREITVPVLAIYGVQHRIEQKYPWVGDLTGPQRDRAERRFAVETPMLARQRDRFRREIPDARLHEIEGGRHYIFLTHPLDCERAIRTFAAALGPSATW